MPRGPAPQRRGQTPGVAVPYSDAAAARSVDAMQQRLLPIADAVMIGMLSRPPSGSLRDARVTTATIALALGVALGVVALGAVLLLRVGAGLSALWLLIEAPLAVVAAGCACLGVFGLRQRKLLRRDVPTL